MKLLYPSNPFQPKAPDESYEEEYAAAIACGFEVRLFSYEDFLAGSFKPRPALEPMDMICYRGWMLTPSEYEALHGCIGKCGASMITTPEAYTHCHYLPSWYPLLAKYTPTTHIYSESEDIVSKVIEHGWTGCFLKDYVKSLSTAGGSLITDIRTIPEVIAKMKKYRGQIEGGVCVREVEPFVAETEMRHFVVRGVPYASEGEVPEIVLNAATTVGSPFFSVDTIQRADGQLRIIELGDGQVSDRKSWAATEFIKLLSCL